MQHTIDDLVAKISVMAEKATLLQNSRYRLDETQLRYMVEDLQAHARDIACDTGDAKSPSGET
jgi:hypothetical protein